MPPRASTIGAVAPPASTQMAPLLDSNQGACASEPEHRLGLCNQLRIRRPPAERRGDVMTLLLQAGKQLAKLTWEILMDQQNPHA